MGRVALTALCVLALALSVVPGYAMDGSDSSGASGVDDKFMEETFGKVDPELAKGPAAQRMTSGDEEVPEELPAEEATELLPPTAMLTRQSLQSLKRKTSQFASSIPMAVSIKACGNPHKPDSVFGNVFLNADVEWREERIRTCSVCMALLSIPRSDRDCVTLFQRNTATYKKCTELGPVMMDARFTPEESEFERAYEECNRMNCCNTVEETLPDNLCTRHAPAYTPLTCHACRDAIANGPAIGKEIMREYMYESCASDHQGHTRPQDDTSLCNRVMEGAGQMVGKKNIRTAQKLIMDFPRSTLSADIISHAACHQAACCLPHVSETMPLDLVVYQPVVPALGDGTGLVVRIIDENKNRFSFDGDDVPMPKWDKTECHHCYRLAVHALEKYHVENQPPPPWHEGPMNDNRIIGCPSGDKKCSAVHLHMDRFLGIYMGTDKPDMLDMGPNWVCSALSKSKCKEHPINTVLDEGILVSAHSERVRKGKPVPGISKKSFCSPLNPKTRSVGLETFRRVKKSFPGTSGMCRRMMGNTDMTPDEWEGDFKKQMCKEGQVPYDSFAFYPGTIGPEFKAMWGNEIVCRLSLWSKDKASEDTSKLEFADFMNMFFLSGFWAPYESLTHEFHNMVRDGVIEYEATHNTRSPKAVASLPVPLQQDLYNIKAARCSSPWYVERMAHFYTAYTWIMKEWNDGRGLMDILGSAENVCCDPENRLPVWEAKEDPVCIAYYKKKEAEALAKQGDKKVDVEVPEPVIDEDDGRITPVSDRATQDEYESGSDRGMDDLPIPFGDGDGDGDIELVTRRPRLGSQPELEDDLSVKAGNGGMVSDDEMDDALSVGSGKAPSEADGDASTIVESESESGSDSGMSVDLSEAPRRYVGLRAN